jgi:hypothetical protein
MTFSETDSSVSARRTTSALEGVGCTITFPGGVKLVFIVPGSLESMLSKGSAARESIDCHEADVVDHAPDLWSIEVHFLRRRLHEVQLDLFLAQSINLGRGLGLKLEYFLGSIA